MCVAARPPAHPESTLLPKHQIPNATYNLVMPIIYGVLLWLMGASAFDS